MTCHIPGCDDTMSCHVMDISSYFRLALSCPVTTVTTTTTTTTHWQITTACWSLSLSSQFCPKYLHCWLAGAGQLSAVWGQVSGVSGVSVLTLMSSWDSFVVSPCHSHSLTSLTSLTSHISPVTQQSHNCQLAGSRHVGIRNESNCWGWRANLHI